ncbi:16S rRNA (uracil(1498)-N(3))-methyltransferase [Oceanobacillus sp. CAU 1775]
MQRYFILDEKSWNDNQVIITGDDVHHMNRVMRFKPGDHIICNDSEGKAARCEIIEIDTQQVVVNIKEWLENDAELPIDVTIAQGLPKGDKFDLILQKGTELGATEFIPTQLERSIVQWDNKKIAKKMQRFEKIIKEASEQSHRNSIPSIQEPMTLQSLINMSSDFDYKLFAFEDEARTKEHHSFATVLKQMKKGQRLLICIGPEGGFSKDEVNLLKENQFQAVRFGPRILRTETAALYALASISYHFEELEWVE